MTRSEHLQWAKDRAIEYLDAGDIMNSYRSFVSDVQKHPDLNYSPSLLSIGMSCMESAEQMRKFILDFN